MDHKSKTHMRKDKNIPLYDEEKFRWNTLCNQQTSKPSMWGTENSKFVTCKKCLRILNEI